MRKLFCVAFLLGLISSELYADARPNPRNNAVTSKTADTAQKMTSRGEKEMDARAEAAENSRINRTTANRTSITNDRIGAKATVARSEQTGIPTVSRSAVARSAPVAVKSSAAANKTSSVARATVRSATVKAIATGAPLPASRGRSATTPGRATALFTNMASLGSEYSSCRESYFACMDQFCGTKSDVYRRCLCSNRFRDFKDREDAFDQAKQMIVQFNDNNLGAIGLSADEVNAMYNATAGEAAIQADTSSSAQLLANINDLLSGKTKANSAGQSAKKDAPKKLDLDFSVPAEDIWGDGSSDGVFGGASSSRSSQVANLENLEGEELYAAVHKQCMDVTESCKKNQASSDMVISAYTVLISQDCSAYEKKLDAQKSALESTIREANGAMMDARLEEFRTHNSASVNECISKVRQSVTDQYACGPKWEKCLDFSGLYINASTGEPIYTPQLFKLVDVINLNDVGDEDNTEFLNNLDKMRNRAKSALDTCRDDADTVWSAFRQQALIEIAQAQDEKIEAVKDECVSTMKQCYDKQTGALNKFAEVQQNSELSGQVQSATGALSQQAARAMCEDKVLACAALYGDPKGCVVDNDGRVSSAAGQTCGLQSLLAFVNTVDDTKIATLCKSDLQSYIANQCTPGGASSSGDQTQTTYTYQRLNAAGQMVPCNTDLQGDSDCSGGYNDGEEAKLAQQLESEPPSRLRTQFPYACRTRPKYGKGSVYDLLIERAKTVCINPETKEFDPSVNIAIREIMEDIDNKMKLVLRKECAAAVPANEPGKAFWVEDSTPNKTEIPKTVLTILPEYVNTVYQSEQAFAATVSDVYTIQIGEASGGSGARTLDGIATAMAAPSDYPELIDADNLFAKGWGTCEVISTKVQCEIMNALVSAGSTTLAVYNPTNKQCEFKPDYYKTVCQDFLAISGGTGTAVWDVQNQECRFMVQ